MVLYEVISRRDLYIQIQPYSKKQTDEDVAKILDDLKNGVISKE